MYTFLCMSFKINFHLLGVVFHRHKKKTLLFISLMLYLAKSSHRAAKKWVNWKATNELVHWKIFSTQCFLSFHPSTSVIKKILQTTEENSTKKTLTTLSNSNDGNSRQSKSTIGNLQRETSANNRKKKLRKNKNNVSKCARGHFTSELTGRVGKEIAMFIEWNLFIVQHLSLICRKSSFAASFHCFAGLRASAPSFSTTFVIVGVFSARPNPVPSRPSFTSELGLRCRSWKLCECSTFHLGVDWISLVMAHDDV